MQFFPSLIACPQGTNLVQNSSYIPNVNSCGPESLRAVTSITKYVNPYFGDCCNAHDICYGTCHPTKKRECDLAILDCMFAKCNDDFSNNWILKRYYESIALVGFWMVYFEGDYSFIGGQNLACKCGDN